MYTIHIQIWDFQMTVVFLFFLTDLLNWLRIFSVFFFFPNNFCGSWTTLPTSIISYRAKTYTATVQQAKQQITTSERVYSFSSSLGISVLKQVCVSVILRGDVYGVGLPVASASALDLLQFLTSVCCACSCTCMCTLFRSFSSHLPLEWDESSPHSPTLFSCMSCQADISLFCRLEGNESWQYNGIFSVDGKPEF